MTENIHKHRILILNSVLSTLNWLRAACVSWVFTVNCGRGM